MTGFGAGRGEAGGEAVSVEVRAVNGKFCEVKPRLPRELMALESETARAVKERVSRGVLEVTVRRGGGGSFEPHIDEALARLYAERFRGLRDRLHLSGEVTLADVV